MRQLEINALERDVAALSGLTDPNDAGARKSSASATKSMS